MKSALTTLVIIITFFVVTHFWAYPAYINHAAEQERVNTVHVWMFHQHKNLIRERISLLEKEIKNLEEKTEFRVEDIALERSCRPDVLFHRLDQPFGGDYTSIKVDAQVGLQRALAYQIVSAQFKTTNKKELQALTTSAPSDIWDKAATEADKIIKKMEEEFTRREQLINLSVWDDVPESFRANQRTMGYLKHN